MYIEKINQPTDVKNLNSEQLHILSDEMRQALLQKLSKHGGHFGPNLGMVEATIALHYVFNSPTDKIVYDVSHQSYPHKMLTGRKDAFCARTSMMTYRVTAIPTKATTISLQSVTLQLPFHLPAVLQKVVI